MKHLIVIALIVVFFTSPAIAGGEEPFTPIDAQKLIDDCWARHQAQIDTGVTSEMREGSAMAIGCLMEVILEQSAAMFDDDYNSKENIQERLDMASIGIQKMYWAIYNEHIKCQDGYSPAFCGTDHHVYHLAKFSSVLEDMIRSMVGVRNEGKF